MKLQTERERVEMLLFSSRFSKENRIQSFINSVEDKTKDIG